MASFIFAPTNNEGLLCIMGVRGKCVPVHFLKVRWEKNPPSAGPAHTHGEITSFIYHFSALFFQQIPGSCATGQERNPPSARERALLLLLFVSVQIEPPPPSLSGVTTRILFRPCRTICQYPGIYRPLILARHRG